MLLSRRLGHAARAVAVCVASIPLAQCALAPTPRLPAPRLDQELPGQCVAREVSRKPLVVEDGRLLYVEPAAFVPNHRGDVMLAGTMNMLIDLSSEGRVKGASGDSVFGALIRRDGRAHIIPSPVPDGRLLTGIRAVARKDGGWSAVFAESKPHPREEVAPDTAVRLWHGIYDGKRWSLLEQLPLPTEGALRPRLAATPVLRGDTLAWAMTLRVPNLANRIALFERRGGRWTYEIIPTFHAQVQLAYSDTLGLMMAVVQPDTMVRSDGNSLILWARKPAWRRVRRVVHGDAEGQVYTPSLTLSPTGGVLSWHAQVDDGPPRAGREARVMIGALEERNTPVVTLDSAAVSTQYPFAPVLLPGGGRLWVVEHALPDMRSTEIRFVRDSAQTGVLMGRIPNPYLSQFYGATAVGPREVLVTGLQYFANRYIVSLLLRVRVECRGDKP